MKFTVDDKTIDSLLLDANNYRFFDLPQWKSKQQDRLHEPTVQESTLRLFESTAKYNIGELRRSFLSNGYVRFERIVVVPYEHADKYYVIVEGNRRIAALRTLLRDNKEGVLTLTPEQIEDFTNIPVAILDTEGVNLIAVQRIIMGIRHIAGPQEWGAYQQALIILQLVDEEGWNFDDIAKHLNLRVMEVRRRYRSIRALKAMENDEAYSKYAKPEYYHLFNELISIPPVREFFSWDNDSAAFTDNEKAQQFYELIEPIQAGIAPKIRTYIDVRRLRTIIGYPQTEEALFDPELSLADAIARVPRDDTTQTATDLVAELKRFKKVLEETQVDILTGIPDVDIKLFEELSGLLLSRVEQYSRLVG